MEIEKRKEMMKALQGKKTERLLCSVWRHLQEEKRTGAYAIEDQLQYYEKTDVDFLKIMSDGYFAYPLKEIPQRASKWFELEPLKDGHPYFIDQIERAKTIVDRLGQKCMIWYNIFAPFSSLRFAASDAMIMRHLQEDEEAVLHALEVIALDNSRLAERILKEAGCDGIYFCVQGGEKKRFSHEEYMRLISPGDQKVLKHANNYSRWNILHCCGYDGFQNHLENWKDYPCCAVNWSVHVENMSLEEGRKFFNGKTVIGGFKNGRDGVLYRGDKKEISEIVQKMLERYRASLGIILGADCSLPWDEDLSNIAWLMNILHRKK